jgi:hypothetical protein
MRGKEFLSYRMTGTYYRGGSEPNILSGDLTAADVVRYERDELGNSDVVTVAGIDLASIPAKHLRWLTETRQAALGYGKVRREVLGRHRIVARDGFGGVLVEICPKSRPAFCNRQRTLYRALQE